MTVDQDRACPHEHLRTIERVEQHVDEATGATKGYVLEISEVYCGDCQEAFVLQHERVAFHSTFHGMRMVITPASEVLLREVNGTS